MNQALSFGVVFGGGLLLTKALTGNSFSEIVKGHAGTVSKTGDTLAGATTVAGVGAAIAGVAAPASNTKSAASIVKYLVSEGISPIAAAGVAGNLQQESSDNAGAAGGGLAQWIGSRYTALEAFAAKLGLPASSETAQLEYLVSDLKGNYSSTLAAMNAASTPEQAAAIFSEQYERPGTPDLSNRQAYAAQAYTAAGYS